MIAVAESRRVGVKPFRHGVDVTGAFHHGPFRAGVRLDLLAFEARSIAVIVETTSCVAMAGFFVRFGPLSPGRIVD